jgi:hypothetical protein
MRVRTLVSPAKKRSLTSCALRRSFASSLARASSSASRSSRGPSSSGSTVLSVTRCHWPPAFWVCLCRACSTRIRRRAIASCGSIFATVVMMTRGIRGSGWKIREASATICGKCEHKPIQIRAPRRIERRFTKLWDMSRTRRHIRHSAGRWKIQKPSAKTPEIYCCSSEPGSGCWKRPRSESVSLSSASVYLFTPVHRIQRQPYHAIA